MTYEEWLQLNTFLCPHGLGRISPEQCEANRARPRLKEACNWNVNLPPMPGPCEKCTEWKELCEQVYQKRKEVASMDETREEEGKKKKNKRYLVKCKLCGQMRPHHGRGLCAKCYSKLAMEGRLEEFPPLRVKGVNEEGVRVVVDFSFCPVVLEKIKRMAEEELRPLPMQIVYLLKKAITEEGE